MFVFIGLGNPGAAYAQHRHNVGFMAIDAIAALHGGNTWRQKFHADIASVRIAGEAVVLVKPQTFMNRSGLSVGEAVYFYKLDAEHIFVFYDEMDLALAKIRIKPITTNNKNTHRASSGHRGIASINAALGSVPYIRVKIGIGHPSIKSAVNPYVLSNFHPHEQPVINNAIQTIANHANDLIHHNYTRVMNALSLSKPFKSEC